MVGAVRKYRLDSARIITIIQQIQEDLIPIVRRIPGFQGFYVLNKEGVVVTVCLFADPRRLHEADEATTAWMQNLGSSVVLLSQEVVVGSVVVEAFE